MKQKILDEELFSLSKEKGDDAYIALMKKYLKTYKRTVSSVAISLCQKNIQTEDFIDIFFISFDKAYQTYDKTKGKFSHYYHIIYRRNIKLYLMNYINSHDILDHCLSLDEEIAEGLSRYDITPNENADDPISYYKRHDATLSLRSNSFSSGKKKDKLRLKAFDYRGEGLTYVEIAKKMSLSQSQVRRLLDVRNKKDFSKIYIKLK